MSDTTLDATIEPDLEPYELVQFRKYIDGLGGAWILFGLLHLAAAAYFISLLGGRAPTDDIREIYLLTAYRFLMPVAPGLSGEVGGDLLFAGAFGVGWMVLG